jgi:predicted regulator of Ras-like GTPase activity (Roadblock/LC7/MglB family)
VGSTVTVDDQGVSNGLFTVVLDFGGEVFAGNARWLEIRVRDGASTGAYTALAPRQALTPAPVATYAERAPWTGRVKVPVDNALATLDSAGDVGVDTSVTVGADGLGLISYYDFDNRDLKVAHCADVACSSATLATLDSAGDVGVHTSVTVGADGLGLISYYDATNDDLKVAHCANAFCTPYFRRR